MSTIFLRRLCQDSEAGDLQGGCAPAWSGTLENEDVVEDKYLFAVQGGQDDLTVPDEVGDVLDRLQVVCLLGVRERLLLQSLGVITFERWLIRC